MSTTAINPDAVLSASILQHSGISIEPWKCYKIPDIQSYTGDYENRKAILDLVTATTIPVPGHNAWELMEKKWIRTNFLAYAEDSHPKVINSETVNFSYYQTLIHLEDVTNLPAFFVQLSWVDDAARIWLFNANYADGISFSDLDVVTREEAAVSTNIRDYLVNGENRLVIVQVDTWKGRTSINIALSLEENGPYFECVQTDQALKTTFTLNADERTGYSHYDISDPETGKVIVEQLNKLKLQPFIPSAGGTLEKPVTIKAGFVFCDFSDVTGGDIDTEYRKLIGEQDELVRFIDAESGGAVNLELEVYRVDGQNTWIRPSEEKLKRLEEELKILEEKKSPEESNEELEKQLGELNARITELKAQVAERTSYAFFKNRLDEFITELDEGIEFPNDWKVVFLAFPSTFGEGGYAEQDGGFVLASSQCKNGMTVDGEQRVSIILMDPSVYLDKHPVRITIHELVHALGLPDLYNATLGRSYGWSLMSDCRTGWHLTGLEKLVLGWDQPEEYIFLKSGELKTALKTQSEQGAVKGVIVLPQDNPSGKCYFMELAQEIGRDDTYQFAENGPGLLVMVTDLTTNQGTISPFVNKRVGSEELYGGAAGAPFYGDDVFKSNGISAKMISDIDSNDHMYSIRVNKNYQFPNRAVQLRENEFISAGGRQFGLTMDGQLSLDSSPCIVNGAVAIEPGKLIGRGYDFYAFVDKNGIFHVAAAVDGQSVSQDTIIQSFNPPEEVVLTEDSRYFFQIESVDNKTSVHIYEGKPEDIPVFRYQLVDTMYTAGWSVKEGDYSLELQSDGNLVLSKQGAWQWGSQNSGITEGKSLKKILLNSQGGMSWMTDYEVMKEFPGTYTKPAPFSLTLNTSNSPKVFLEVRDSSNELTHSVSLSDPIL